MKFTLHGKHRAAERKITKKSIFEALRNPSRSFYDLSSSAYIVFKKLDGNQLLVVYAQEANDIRIITTFITSVAQEIINNKLNNNVWVEI